MPVAAILAGVATFVVAHLVQVAIWNWLGRGAHEPWFLNTGRAVLFTAICFVVTGAIVGAVADRPRALSHGALVGAGGVLASIAVLFWIGPGSLFPVAIAIGAAVLVVSGVAGASIPYLVRRPLRRR